MTILDESRKGAAFWLFALIVAVSVTPRIRLDGGSGNIDVRAQDILLIPIVLYLLNYKRGYRPLTSLWGFLLPAFIWLAIVGTLLVALLHEEVPLFRRIAFLGRALELFLIAAAVAGLYLRAGTRGFRAAVGAIVVSGFANFAWVAAQMATDQRQTLIGGEVGDNITSYGPKLIGEPSAFGTGQMFAFIAAAGVAYVQSRSRNRWVGVVLLAMGAIGAFAADSRASLVVIAFATVIMFTFSRGKINPLGLVIAIIGVVILAVIYMPNLQGRLSEEAILQSLGFRVTEVWGPLLELIDESPLLGLGHGALISPLPVEGHNIVVRAWVDYGMVTGALFLLFFLVVIVKAWRGTSDNNAAIEYRMFANLAFIFTVSILVAGMVQDALTGVMSSHLEMIAIGLFAAVSYRRKTEAADETLSASVAITSYQPRRPRVARAESTSPSETKPPPLLFGDEPG